MHRPPDPFEKLTVEEIVEEFSTQAHAWGWTTHKLVGVWMSGGLDGKWNNSIKRHVFTRVSVQMYIRHCNTILRSKIRDLPFDEENFGSTGTG